MTNTVPQRDPSVTLAQACQSYPWSDRIDELVEEHSTQRYLTRRIPRYRHGELAGLFHAPGHSGRDAAFDYMVRQALEEVANG
jgi:hypothetical protein